MLQKLKTWDFAGKFLWKRRYMKPRELGKWTKNQLTELGPTFVKLGQIASSRKDLYEPEFIEELESLQDNVSPIPEDLLTEVLNPELFLSIDLEPFKSASLGQVHKAVLPNGKPVIVKIQRPNVRTIIESDIKNISEVLTLLELVGLDTGAGSNDIFQEAVCYLYEELDYKREANNTKIFYEVFRDTGWVRIPRIYSKMVTETMLVMEYVEGTKITKVSNKKVAKALINSFLFQVMEFGVFHGDPHPGNLAVSPDGQLVYYDFGLIITLPDDLRDNIIKLIPLIIQRDTPGLVDSMIEMNFIIPNADKVDIILFLESFMYRKDILDKDDISGALAKEKPFRIPSEFVFLGKSIITINGICKQLDPNFNFVDYIQPMLEDEISFNINDILDNYSQMPVRIKTMNDSIKSMERSKRVLKQSLEQSKNEMRLILLLVLILQNIHLW